MVCAWERVLGHSGGCGAGRGETSPGVWSQKRPFHKDPGILSSHLSIPAKPLVRGLITVLHLLALGDPATGAQGGHLHWHSNGKMSPAERMAPNPQFLPPILPAEKLWAFCSRCAYRSVPHDKPGAPTGRYRTPCLAPSASRPPAGGGAGFVQRSPGRRPRPNKGPFYREPAVWLPAASHLRSAGTRQLNESFFFLFFLNKSKFYVPASSKDQMEKIRGAGGVNGAPGAAL